MRFNFLLPLIFLPFQIWAQTPTDKPLAEMTWLELTEKWESIAVKGKNAAALPFAQAALERARQDSTEQSLAYGTSLDNLGYSLHHTNQLAKAETAFGAAVEHARQHLGENHEDFVTRLSNLAMLHYDMDELAKAASELEIAVRTGEKSLGPDNGYLGIFVNNLALVYEGIGNYQRALHFYRYALELTERTVGKEHARYGARLHNLSAIYRKLGNNPAEALDLSQRARTIFEKTLGKEHPQYANVLNGLADSYALLGRYEEALRVSDELLVWLESRGANEATSTFHICITIARTYLLAGQHQRCADFAAAKLEKYGKMYPYRFDDRAFLARVCCSAFEKTGKLDEAARYAKQANDLYLRELEQNFGKFSEEEQAYRAVSRVRSLNAGQLLFAARHPDLPDMNTAAYDFQMTVKGLSLANRRLLFQSIRGKNDATGLADRFEEWLLLEKEISRLYALVPAQRPTNLDSLLTRASSLERSLALESEPFRRANQSPRWQDVQAALAPGEAAIEFGQLKILPDTSLYFAWLVRPGDAAPHRVFLFEEKTLGNLAATRKLYAPNFSPDENNLHRLLWSPLAPFLNGVSTVFFAPAGVLHQINFGAIPISASEVVDDHFRLHRIVSTREVMALKKAARHAAPRSALIFGGIRYDAGEPGNAATGMAAASRSFENLWGFLPGSLAEAQSVRQFFEKTGAKITFVEGAEASESFFKKAIEPPPAVLHLATHGFFAGTPDSTARAGFEAAENPMARAGLVLANGNRAWSGEKTADGEEDGILTALEISHLDLSGTEVAVLSACGTGQGKVEAGEGILGLQRAFKMAGTRYVVLTLWNVQDHHARQFMDLFYAAWLSQKMSVPDAFRSAQHEMRRRFDKPFQPGAWAGFLLLE